MKSMTWEETIPPRPFLHSRIWLVMGSAGSGKSRRLEEAIDGLISEGVTPGEIMYILFNKKPATEFKARYLVKGYDDKDMPWFGTHHAIMRRLLKIPPKNILEGKSLMAWGKDNGFLFSEAVCSTNETVKNNAYDEIFHSLSKKLYTGQDNFTPLERKLLLKLQESEAVDNLWTHVRYLCRGCTMRLFPLGVKYIFVDEAQDNGKVQMDWLKDMAMNPEIKGTMLAGDDKQAINEFKGSDPELFLDFPAERFVALRTTYRCPPVVLKAANDVIFPVRRRSPLSTSSARQIKGSVLRFPSFLSAVGRLEKELQAGKSFLGLVRNNFIKNQLYRMGECYKLPFYQEKYAVLRSVLTGLKEIKRSGLLTATTLATIMPHKRKRLGELRTDAYWTPNSLALLRSGKFTVPSALSAYAYLAYGDGLPLDEITTIGFDSSFLTDLENWRFDIDKWNLSRVDLGIFKNLLQWEKRGCGEIKLMTIHSAKGLEAENVILFTDIANLTWKEEQMYPDRERRVWYVGISRCFSELIITQANPKNKSTGLIIL